MRTWQNLLTARYLCISLYSRRRSNYPCTISFIIFWDLSTLLLLNLTPWIVKLSLAIMYCGSPREFNPIFFDEFKRFYQTKMVARGTCWYSLAGWALVDPIISPELFGQVKGWKILSFLLLEIGALMNLIMMIMLPFSFYFQVIYLRLWLSSPYFSHLTKYGDYLTKLNTLESVFYTWTWFPCLAKPPIRSLVLF